LYTMIPGRDTDIFMDTSRFGQYTGLTSVLD